MTVFLKSPKVVKYPRWKPDIPSRHGGHNQEPTMADEITGVTEPAAEVQTPAEGDTGAVEVPQDGENRQVPVSVLNAMREEMKTIKDQNSLYQAQLAKTQEQQQQPQSQPQTNDPLSGREADDLISVADVRKILEANSANSQKHSAALNSQIAKIGFIAEHPDYKDVLNNLKNTMAGNNELANMLNAQIQSSNDPLQTAYAFAKAIGVKTEQPKDALSELDKILANQEKPGSPSAVSGGGGSVGAKSKYDIMTPDEFEQHLLAIKNS